MTALKLMGGIVSPVSQIEGVFLFANGKMSWLITRGVSLEMVFWAPRTNVKMDGFESFSNITRTVPTV